jgi:hypothetical protein
MPGSEPDVTEIGTIERLAGASAEERTAILEGAPWMQAPEALVRLADEIARRIRVDLDQAEHLAEAAADLVRVSGDAYAAARALRSIGHVHALRSRMRDALEAYTAAIARFERGRHDIDVAITRSGALQTLIYLGRYDEAFDWAARARTVFDAHGDDLRLARLETNLGNVLYRQDRFGEALVHYERALSAFRSTGEAQDVAITLRNLAVCHISLHDFERAASTYRDARDWCEEHGLAGLVAEVDYNVAYLFYLRGEYGRAIDLYRVARDRCVTSGDRYHAALCDLDQSELYLEINLVAEGLALARRAQAGFVELSLGYESAKAIVNIAIGEHLRGRPRQAERRFVLARAQFVAEGNDLWPALIDLYRALVLEHESPRRAERLCKGARVCFARTSLVSRQALSELLLARLLLRRGRAAEARGQALGALTRAEQVGMPALEYQAAFSLGVIDDHLGRASAEDWFRRAQGTLETLRGRLHRDELRIAFLENKQAVFEYLVACALARGEAGSEEAFAWIEKAKSRSLADQIASEAHRLPVPLTARPEAAARLRLARERLHSCELEIRRAEAAGQQPAGTRIRGLCSEAQRCEGELVRLFQDLGSGADEFVSLQTAGVVPLAAVRDALPHDGALLEYYEARGRLSAVLLTRDRLDTIPLGDTTAVRARIELLRFQLSKFRLRGDYVERFAEPLEQAARAHLRAIHDEVLGPLRSRLESARHLVIVPHGPLHYVPFHALHDGDAYLVDRFDLSYAPCASVLHYCRHRPAHEASGALVLGVVDPSVPSIPQEVAAVAAVLPGARVFVGAEATEARLREEGAGARYVHVATHGRFRQDSPLFSSICLADRDVSLLDLYQLRLSADLVTLSGCGTGLNVVIGGDELIGLTRGLLFAGARAVLVTLWDVHDASTATLMADFYTRLAARQEKAEALGCAMRAVRATHPHPYYWAPFVLIGALGDTRQPPAAGSPL